MTPNKKIIIKDRVVAQPAAQEEILKVQAPPNTPFLKPGTRVYMDSELKAMEILDIEPGEQLPPEFKEHMRNEIASQKLKMENLSSRGNLKERKVTLSDLPVEKQEELRDLLQQIKSSEKSPSLDQSYLAEGVASLPPQLAESMAAIDNAGGKKFVGKVVGGKASPAPEPVKPPEPAQSQTGVTTPAKECQVCGWPCDKPIDAAPTDDDKINYLISIEGGQKFKKQYVLFGGRIMVTFQTLGIKDYERCLREIDKKRAAKDLLSIDHAASLIADYRLALSISQIVTTKSSNSYPESAKDWFIEEDGIERVMTLDEILDHFHADSPVKDDGIWRAVAHVWQRFNSINAVLEMHAADPNFYRAIGTRS